MTGARQRNRNSSYGSGRSLRILALLMLFGVICLSLLRVSSVLPHSSGTESEAILNAQELSRKGEVPGLNFSNPECRKFQSQHGEDSELFIQYWAFPTIKRDGVFLEIGAYDGVEMSNSYWYERCLGWTGVLIEGHPRTSKYLRKRRPDTVQFEAAACEKDEGNVTFVGGVTLVSGVAGQMPDSFVRDNHMAYLRGYEETHIVKCRRISSMLQEAKVDHIDFWTLDVEGAEFTVLSTFDWVKVPVHILVIETDKDESTDYKQRHDLLTSKGMKYVGPIYNNELWENPNYPDIVFPPPQLSAVPLTE